MKHRVFLFAPLVIFALLGVVFWSVLKNEDYQPDKLPSALLNQPLPTFALPSLTDDTTITQDRLIGQPFLLNVWATWCPTCYAEHSYLNTLAEQGIRIVGVNYKDDVNEARAWLARLGNPYVDIVVDKEGKLGLDLGVYGAPETYIIDANGIIRFKYIGDVNDRVWRKTLQPVWQTVTKSNPANMIK